MHDIIVQLKYTETQIYTCTFNYITDEDNKLSYTTEQTINVYRYNAFRLMYRIWTARPMAAEQWGQGGKMPPLDFLREGGAPPQKGAQPPSILKFRFAPPPLWGLAGTWNA